MAAISRRACRAPDAQARHHFQIVAVNGARFAGAIRGTVLVPAQGTVVIAFDAGGPGPLGRALPQRLPHGRRHVDRVPHLSGGAAA